MFASKFRVVAAAACAITGVLLANPAFIESGTTHVSTSQTLSLRGDLTRERYRIYSKRLHDYYATLLSALKSHAQSDLLSIVAPPQEIKSGYQIVPKILSEDPAPEQRAGVVAYSWPWTDKLIDDAMLEINRSVTLLAGAAKTSPLARRSTYASLVERYRQLRQQIQNIDGHIQYNHLWQTTIAERRATYDRETALLSLVVQRNAIREWLNEAYPDRKDNTLVDLIWLHTEQDFNFVESELRGRETALTRAIAAATTEIVDIPNYVRVERQPGLWIFHVPFDTDIEDQDFLTSMKQAIETTWRLHDRNDEYRLQVSFRFISVEQLYPGNERPEPGAKIDLKKHLAQFPKNAAILTTGALTTYVSGRAIVLGPQDIYGRILAHEMGHILGFRDNYIRGYKDLGRNGFQIMEVVADSNDLMANVNSGLVLPYHFQKLLNRRQTNAAVQ
jgi:hypothetical protein